MTGYSIGQLAQAAGVATSTVRFYERAGLIQPEARTGANYRAYTQRSLERLRFIRAAQGSGFALQDIRELLLQTDSEQPPCREVMDLIANRLAQVREKLAELQRVERALDAAHKNCCHGGKDFCREVQRLKGTITPASQRRRKSLQSS
jgi:MerR family mercuric resistance operon transcriptional regulator